MSWNGHNMFGDETMGGVEPNGFTADGNPAFIYRYDVGGPDDPNVILADIAAGRRTDDPDACFRWPPPADCVHGVRTGTGPAAMPAAVNTAVAAAQVSAPGVTTSAPSPAPVPAAAATQVQPTPAIASDGTFFGFSPIVVIGVLVGGFLLMQSNSK